MLSSNNMIALKGKTIIGKGNPAILTFLPCPVPNFLNQPPVHKGNRDGSSNFRCVRAFDCMIVSKLPTCK
jgi:hypothetical protein